MFFFSKGWLSVTFQRRTQYLPKIAKRTTLPGKAHIDIHISINVNSHSSVTEETEGVPFKKVYKDLKDKKKTKSKEGVKLELLYLFPTVRSSPTYMYVVH